jgi:hypothetical protein
MKLAQQILTITDAKTCSPLLKFILRSSNTNVAADGRSYFNFKCQSLHLSSIAIYVYLDMDPGVDGRIIFKWISGSGMGGMDWIERAQDRDR